MRYNKLDISDDDRKLRRAAQIKKATYKCSTCKRSLYSKPGEEWICGFCYRRSLERETDGQTGLFTLATMFPWVAMVEMTATTPGKKPLAEISPVR